METKLVLTTTIVALAAFALLTASSLVTTNVYSQNASSAVNQTKAGAGAAANNTSAAAKNVTQGAENALNQTGKALSNTGNNIMQGLKNLFSGNSTQK